MIIVIAGGCGSDWCMREKEESESLEDVDGIYARPLIHSSEGAHH